MSIKYNISANTLCTDDGIFATLLYSDQFKGAEIGRGIGVMTGIQNFLPQT